MTDQQKSELQRAIEIANEYGHRVHTARINRTGETAYTVRSHSDPNMHHVLYIQAGRIVCDCYASHHGHICSHAAAVRLFLLEQRAALAAVEAHDAQQAEAERLAALPRELAGATTSESAKMEALDEQEAVESAVRWNHPDDLDKFSSDPLYGQIRAQAERSRQREAHVYGEHPALPEGWEINEEGAGWVAREHGRAVLTPRGRNIKRFSSWFAAQHAIDNQQHDERSRQRDAALPVDHTPEAFSIFR